MRKKGANCYVNVSKFFKLCTYILEKKLCIFRRWLEKTEEIEQGEEAYDEIFTRRQETPRGKN